MKEKKEKKKIEFEKYTLKEKLLISCLTGFTVSFVLILFGSIDIYSNNIKEFAFTFKDIALPLFLLFIGVAVLISAVLMLFQRIWLNILSSIPISIIISSYVCNFLLSKPMIVSGDATEMSNTEYYIMIVTYVVIIFGTMYLSIFITKKWKSLITFLCVLLIGMNGASLVSDFIKNDLIHDNDISCEYVLSKKGMNEVSEKENIIYILFDRFDNEYIDAVNKEEPGFFDDLEGFTYFDSAVSEHTRTFPAGASMITGNHYTGQMSAEDFLNTTYSESDFLNDLKNNGYSINIYAHRYYIYSDAKALLDTADNVEEITSYTANTKLILKYLTNLSSARLIRPYLAQLMYASANAGITSKFSTFECEDGVFIDDDAWLSDYYNENSLTANNTEKNYTFLYFHGSHAPYILDSNGDLSESATEVSQTIGSFKTIKQYLDYLKDIGVYDNSTIIITGDHGNPHEETQPLHEIVDNGVTTAIFVKPRNAHNKTLVTSSAEVSINDLVPTIVKDAGIKTDKDYGESVFDISENEHRTRVFYQSVYDLNKHRLGLNKYEIVGDAHDINNWNYVEQIKTEYAWY